MSLDDELQPTPVTAPAESAELQSRYGRTPGRRFRGRVIAWIAGAGVAVVIAAWVIWAGLDSNQASLDTQDTAHSVIDAHSVQVEFNVTAPRGSTVSCALQALSDSFAVVGWKVVELPASDRATRSFTETVRTSELASTGLIYSCWLT